jgi:protein phosphatase
MNIAAVLADFQNRRECLERYTEAYRRYCWPVSSVDDYRVHECAFTVLALENENIDPRL